MEVSKPAFSHVALSAEIQALIHTYGQSTEGMMDPAELSDLVRALLYSEPKESEIILELGTFRGNTASLLADALNKLDKSNLVVSVDAFDMVVPNEVNPRGSLEKWLDNNARWGNGTIVIRGFTRDVATFIKPGCVSLLLLDAYHEYESVYEDISMYLPTVNGWNHLR